MISKKSMIALKQFIKAYYKYHMDIILNYWNEITENSELFKTNWLCFQGSEIYGGLANTLITSFRKFIKII